MSSLVVFVSTILVEPACVAHLTKDGDVCIDVSTGMQCVLGTELNAIQLSIFSHRFMSIAGLMGQGGEIMIDWIMIVLNE